MEGTIHFTLILANWWHMLPFVPHLTSSQTPSCHTEIPTLHSVRSPSLIDIVKYCLLIEGYYSSFIALLSYVDSMQKSKGSTA